jgi:hypothetical protein
MEAPVNVSLPSSAIQVVEQTQSQLVIFDPPYYMLGWFFLGVGLVLVLVAFAGKLSDSRLPVMGIFLVIGIPSALIGLAVSGCSTTTALSAETGRMVITSSCLAVPIRTNNIPIDAIQRALVETEGSSRRLAIRLRSGQLVPTSDNLTDRDGYHEAAAAINHFIGKPE